MMHFRWPLLLLILGIFGLQPALASQGSRLHEAISRANWNDSMYYYRSIPIRDSLPLLRTLSENNVVMAQWFFADALAETGNPQEAAKWLYAASLGTRMDAKICRLRESENVEYRFASAFSKNFAPIRADDEHRRYGLTNALAFHKRRIGKSSHPDWVCRMVQGESRRKTRTMVIVESRWEGMRKGVYDDYEKQSGLANARTPDLIRIHPVN